MENIFDSIKHVDDANQEYWLAREMCITIGYREYKNFKPVIKKAMDLCTQNGKNICDHFVQQNEMIKIGKGGQRTVGSYRLSRYACLLISMSLSSKKENALPALEYFSGKQTNSQLPDTYLNTDMVFFSDPEGKLRIELIFDGDTVWTTQKRIAEIFLVDVRTVSYHINEILNSGELNRYSVVQKNWITAEDGKKYETNVYNLDMIIAVGYRVNSYKATRFRQWATNVLSEYIRNGAVLDDERFKQGGKQVFLDSFLSLSSYPILLDKGKVSALEARIKAYEEYEKFRVIQDREFLSDFDKEVLRLKQEMDLFEGDSD